ncbi:hypothetical protein [Vibrio diazotrophicus]|uniref:hypothetical protein n=1 Tax=Vibrio diazotrophicus TaxID=685 RepID=UPI000C9DBD8E|nr:hypothetical protein [Vibrio diazotrophicus]PNH91799.1 hypothetical protein C1O24_21010 [Vibrio diazotrophicus]
MYKEVDIYWEGPFEVEYDRDTMIYSIPSDIPDDLKNAQGFYQIYGDHPVYGKDVLLYIGETKPSKNGNRNFGIRMKEHLFKRFWYHHGLKIRLGLGQINESNVTDRNTILAVESLLIASNMPALNREHLDHSNDYSKQFIVRNWNFKGTIAAECSGKYWAQT